LKKRVHGYTARINSRHAGGRHYGHLFGAMLLDIFEKGRFASTGTASQEKAAVGLVHKPHRQLKIFVG